MKIFNVCSCGSERFIIAENKKEAIKIAQEKIYETAREYDWDCETIREELDSITVEVLHPNIDKGMIYEIIH